MKTLLLGAPVTHTYSYYRDTTCSTQDPDFKGTSADGQRHSYVEMGDLGSGKDQYIPLPEPRIVRASQVEQW